MKAKVYFSINWYVLYKFFLHENQAKILYFSYLHRTELKNFIWALNDTVGQNLGFYELQNHSNNDCFRVVYLRKKDTWLENFICLHFLKFSPKILLISLKALASASSSLKLESSLSSPSNPVKSAYSLWTSCEIMWMEKTDTSKRAWSQFRNSCCCGLN